MNDLIVWAIGGLAALLAVVVGVWRTYSAGKSAGKDEVKRDQSERETQTNRRVADAQEDNRTIDIDERRKRMFGDDETRD